jgi:hypothetical protein
MLVVRPVLCCQLAGTAKGLPASICLVIVAEIDTLDEFDEFRKFDSATLDAVPAVTVEFLSYFAR